MARHSSGLRRPRTGLHVPLPCHRSGHGGRTALYLGEAWRKIRGSGTEYQDDGGTIQRLLCAAVRWTAWHNVQEVIGEWIDPPGWTFGCYEVTPSPQSRPCSPLSPLTLGQRPASGGRRPLPHGGQRPPPPAAWHHLLPPRPAAHRPAGHLKGSRACRHLYRHLNRQLYRHPGHSAGNSRSLHRPRSLKKGRQRGVPVSVAWLSGMEPWSPSTGCGQRCGGRPPRPPPRSHWKRWLPAPPAAVPLPRDGAAPPLTPHPGV